jgi:hypothetical protein
MFVVDLKSKFNLLDMYVSLEFKSFVVMLFPGLIFELELNLDNMINLNKNFK